MSQVRHHEFVMTVTIKSRLETKSTQGNKTQKDLLLIAFERRAFTRSLNSTDGRREKTPDLEPNTRRMQSRDTKGDLWTSGVKYNCRERGLRPGKEGEKRRAYCSIWAGLVPPSGFSMGTIKDRELVKMTSSHALYNCPTPGPINRAESHKSSKS